MAGSLAKHVIRPGEVKPGWVALYVVTLAMQAYCAFVRGMASFLVLFLAFTLLGWSIAPLNMIAVVIGYGPLAISLATLILPLGGSWFQQQEGGRSPSEREQLLFDGAFGQLTLADPGLRLPHRWAVLDDGQLNACVYADTLLITRGLPESPWLTAVLAHELGHMNSSDGRLTAAIHRLTVPPRSTPDWDQRHPFIGTLMQALMFVATGALPLWLLRGPWGIYWRAKEHAADQYAARLGQAEQLAEYLDIHALPWDLPVPFMWLTEHSHPPGEHWIDRLYRYEPQGT